MVVPNHQPVTAECRMHEDTGGGAGGWGEGLGTLHHEHPELICTPCFIWKTSGTLHHPARLTCCALRPTMSSTLHLILHLGT